MSSHHWYVGMMVAIVLTRGAGPVDLIKRNAVSMSVKYHRLPRNIYRNHAKTQWMLIRWEHSTSNSWIGMPGVNQVPLAVEEHNEVLLAAVVYTQDLQTNEAVVLTHLIEDHRSILILQVELRNYISRILMISPNAYSSGLPHQLVVHRRGLPHQLVVHRSALVSLWHASLTSLVWTCLFVFMLYCVV